MFEAITGGVSYKLLARGISKEKLEGISEELVLGFLIINY